MAKTGISDKTTGQTLTAAEFNTVKNTVDGNDDLRLAVLQAAQAAQADADTAIANAATAQSTADAALPTATFLSQGNTLANQITVDAYNKYYDRETGGTWSFTMAASGNLDKGFFQIELDLPVSVSFSADFIQENTTSIDTTKLNKIIGYYDETDDKMYYAITTITSQSGDVTAPTVESATVENADPDALVVVFSEVVTITDTTGLSLNGDWTGITIDSVTGSGTNTLTFALSGAIANGETGNFVYGGTNNIIDGNSNALVAGSTAVTNNVVPAAYVDDYKASFNGTTQFVRISDDAGIRRNSDQPFSFGGYFDLTSTGLADGLVSASSSSETLVIWIITSGGDLALYMYNNGTIGSNRLGLTLAAANIPAGENHYMVTYSGGESTAALNLYINGSLQTAGVTKEATGFTGSTWPTGGGWDIGRWLDNSNFGLFNCNEFVLFMRELDASQVAQVYNAGSSWDVTTLASGGPDVFLRFEQNLNDSSGNGYATATSAAPSYVAT